MCITCDGVFKGRGDGVQVLPVMACLKGVVMA